MKNLFFFLLFSLQFFNANAQDQKKLDAVKLIDIIEKADFAMLVKLVSSLNYIVLDSSKAEDGSLFYFAKEPKIEGNILACSTDKKIKITELTFNTFSKVGWLEMKSQLSKIGFKSSGIHKENRNGIIESEDFENGKIIVITAIRKNKDQNNFYEFTFIKF